MRKSIQAATLVAIFLLGGVALAASFPRWTDNLTIGYSSIFASAPVGTPQPVSGYPVIGTCIRTTIAAANTSTESSALAAGRYVITPSAQMWFHPVAASTPVTTSNGVRIGDVPGEHFQFQIDGTTQDRVAVITSSGTATVNICAETY